MLIFYAGLPCRAACSRRTLNLSLLLLLAVLMMTGCGGGSGSSGNDSVDGASVDDADRLNIVKYIRQININALDGVNDTVVMEYTDTPGNGTYPATLNIYKQTPVNKNNLDREASVYLGVDTLYKQTTNINTNSDWVAVTLKRTLSDSGWVALVSLSNAPTYQLDLLLEIPHALKRSAAAGEWLIALYDNTLALYDISDISTPVHNQDFTLSSEVTNIACLSNGCYLFSDNGYYYLDLSNSASINLIEAVDADLKWTHKSYIVGTNIMLAGRSDRVSNTRVVKLDVTDPFNPIKEVIKDDILGRYIEFAYDQSLGYYYVITGDILYKYRENNGALIEVYAAAISAGRKDNKFFAAYNERLYDGQPGITIWKY